MSLTKNLMITLTDDEIQHLENLSLVLGCSKSRVIANALKALDDILTNAGFAITTEVSNEKNLD